MGRLRGARTTAPIENAMKKSPEIKFPDDEGSHRANVEWWYWNGHLHDTAGKKYAFMNCLFKINPLKIQLPFPSLSAHKTEWYFAHSIVSDIDTQKSYPAIDPVCIVSRDSFENKKLSVRYSSPFELSKNAASEMRAVAPNHYHVKNNQLDLSFISKKPPLFENGTGLLRLGAAEVYYYSLTHLETKGTIVVDGKHIPVEGTSWFDHEWSDTEESKIAWTWFSIQLESNIEIICFALTQGNNELRLASVMLENGGTLHTNGLTLTDRKDYWVSPKTEASYPLSWDISIPEHKIELTTAPLIREQEMLYGFINYWEGPIAVAGTFRGKKVSGQGFLELVGCPIKESRISIVRQEINEVAHKIAASRKTKIAK